MVDSKCRSYETYACSLRSHVFKCWLERFGKIPRNCVSPHKIMEDVCPTKDRKRAFRSSPYCQTTQKPAGFRDIRIKPRVIDDDKAYIPVEAIQ